jgi:hypothetical protein
MRKKIIDKGSKVIRVGVRTARLLNGMNKKSYDEATMFLWGKISIQGKELNQWRKESGCRGPDELRRLLDTLFQENNKLREKQVMEKSNEMQKVPEHEETKM